MGRRKKCEQIKRTNNVMVRFTDLCQRENLYQVDLLSPAQSKITEAEYWLQKRGQKELEDINEQIIADGMNPMETTFQTRKQFVRNFRLVFHHRFIFPSTSKYF